MELTPGGGDDELHVGTLLRNAAAQFEAGLIARELGLGYDHFDLGMLLEHRRRCFCVVGVKSVESRFAKDVGSDQSDKWLSFNNQSCGPTRRHVTVTCVRTVDKWRAPPRESTAVHPQLRPF